MSRRELLELCHLNGYFPTAAQLGALEIVCENHSASVAEQVRAATDVILEWKGRFPNREFTPTVVRTYRRD